MFEISIETHFNADHALKLSENLIEPCHAHDWIVNAVVSSEKLNNIGIVMDFHKLKGIIENITSELSDINLGDLQYFQQNNPSAENVAKYIFEKLEPQLPKNVKLEYISVVEEPTCKGIFRK